MITTQRGNESIIFKNCHFGLKRKKKNDTKIGMCTNKLCKASVKTQEFSVVKTAGIKADGGHD